MIRSDLIKLWKIFHGKVSAELLMTLDQQSHASTRGHPFKLAIPRCRTDLKRRFFNVRRVQLWNSLPASAVNLGGLDAFKNFLDSALAETFYSFS